MSTSRDLSGWVGNCAPITCAIHEVIVEPEPVVIVVNTPPKAFGAYVPIHLREGYTNTPVSTFCPGAPVKKRVPSRMLSRMQLRIDEENEEC
jgi:hypothetical protein